MKIENLFKAKIVHLILSRKTEDALKLLSQHYHIDTPKLKVGMPKRHIKNAGCYVASKKTIYVSNRNRMYDPYLILHEFYHHLRTQDMKHKGTEKYADYFAKEHIEAYEKLLQLKKSNMRNGSPGEIRTPVSGSRARHA